MHLVFYGRNLLDLYGLSTGSTLALVFGAGYGCMRAAIDFAASARRMARTLRRRPPASLSAAEEARLVAAVRRALDAERRPG